MLRKEYPSLFPHISGVNEVATATMDVSEFIVKLSKEGRLLHVPELDCNLTLHNACHSRAQNVGFKSQEMLNLIPGVHVHSVERCSGHGGTFGVMEETYDTAMKVGKPVFKKTLDNVKEMPAGKRMVISSDCPLAMDHIKDGVSKLDKEAASLLTRQHPVQVLAAAYGLITFNK